MQDFYGDNIDVRHFKHPNSTVCIHGVPKKIHFTYYTCSNAKKILNNLATEYSHIAKLHELGKSDSDHIPINAVQISQNVRKDRELLKPMFKFVANINGDDGVGFSLMVISFVLIFT